MTGELEALAHYAGQSAGLVRSVQPAGAIVEQLVDEAEAILAALARR
jgi:nitronate monooxygenase